MRDRAPRRPSPARPAPTGVCAGRPFFIRIGVSHASLAPASSSVASTLGQTRGSRSSTLASRTTAATATRLDPRCGVGSSAACPRTTRTTLGRSCGVAGSGADADRLDSHGREVLARLGQRGDQRHARGRGKLAGPAGTDLPALGEFEDRGHRDGDAPVRGPDLPEPRATGPALSRTMPRASSAAHTPTTSAMESHAPTSWKCTSSTGVPWARASAAARRRNTARARSARRPRGRACASIPRMSRPCPMREVVARTTTSTLVARMPPRRTSVATRSHGLRHDPVDGGLQDSPSGAPASTRAPSSMSPATPALGVEPGMPVTSRRHRGAAICAARCPAP